MPWHVARTDQCPTSRPWGVINDDTGRAEGRCHATQEAANQQREALYANEPSAGRNLVNDCGCDPVQTRASVDNSSWDGNAAMAACSDAACYRAICAGRKSGPADERGSWALPHHKRPGSPPNAAGVRNALSRLPQTQGLTNAEAARRHLEAHMRAIQAAQGGGRSYEEVDGMAAVERRFTTFPVEPRAAAEGKRTIGGYAAVFNKPSQNLGGFIEVVTPTFFNRSRGQDWPDVMARFNHDDNMVLGTTRSRRLRLSVDDTGLSYDVDLPEAYPGPYLFEMVRSGDISRSSFAFRVSPDGDEWSLSDTGYPTRSLLNGVLIDVAPVTQPAYLDTSVGLRSLAQRFDADLEEVRTLAQQDELRRFFIKTEAGMYAPKPPKRRLSGAAALARIRERETT